MFLFDRHHGFCCLYGMHSRNGKIDLYEPIIEKSIYFLAKHMSVCSETGHLIYL